MNTAKHLVAQIRRKQLLVCAHRRDDDSSGPTLADLTELLEIGAGECDALVHRLHARGLISMIGADQDLSIRLTPRGQRLLDRMAVPRLSGVGG